jgi:hypothetical protein
MPLWVGQLCDSLTSTWVAATPADYGRIALLIVVLGWVCAKQTAHS